MTTKSRNDDKTKQNSTPDEELVDETLEETFPASDAPAWYAGKDKDKKKQQK